MTDKQFAEQKESVKLEQLKVYFNEWSEELSAASLKLSDEALHQWLEIHKKIYFFVLRSVLSLESEQQGIRIEPLIAFCEELLYEVHQSLETLPMKNAENIEQALKRSLNKFQTNPVTADLTETEESVPQMSTVQQREFNQLKEKKLQQAKALKAYVGTLFLQLKDFNIYINKKEEENKDSEKFLDYKSLVSEYFTNNPGNISLKPWIYQEKTWLAPELAELSLHLNEYLLELSKNLLKLDSRIESYTQNLERMNQELQKYATDLLPEEKNGDNKEKRMHAFVLQLVYSLAINKEKLKQETIICNPDTDEPITLPPLEIEDEVTRDAKALCKEVVQEYKSLDKMGKTPEEIEALLRVPLNMVRNDLMDSIGISANSNDAMEELTKIWGEGWKDASCITSRPPEMARFKLALMSLHRVANLSSVENQKSPWQVMAEIFHDGMEQGTVEIGRGDLRFMTPLIQDMTACASKPDKENINKLSASLARATERFEKYQQWDDVVRARARDESNEKRNNGLFWGGFLILAGSLLLLASLLVLAPTAGLSSPLAIAGSVLIGTGIVKLRYTFHCHGKQENQKQSILLGLFGRTTKFVDHEKKSVNDVSPPGLISPNNRAA